MRTTFSWAKWIANLYRDTHPSHYYYVLAKVLSDDLANTLRTLSLNHLDQRNSLGHVLDVGCGRGQFDFLISLFNNVESLTGVDLDARKIVVANKALACWNIDQPLATPIKFKVGDATALGEGCYDTILLFDVFNTLEHSEQHVILAQLASRLNDGGRLFVRESIRGDGPSVSKWLEPLARKFGTNIGRNMAFPTYEQLCSCVQVAGLEIIAERTSPLLKSRFLTLKKATSHAH
ncbi:MAG: class I SAM-dependent methyltransferase [Gammaproteobacteria bacterium]|nr:class I SAM-dependent methyltransferase [Gammaproteobacteria bacterium]